MSEQVPSPRACGEPETRIIDGKVYTVTHLPPESPEAVKKRDHASLSGPWQKVGRLSWGAYPVVDGDNAAALAEHVSHPPTSATRGYSHIRE